MGTFIVIGVLVIVLLFACRGSLKHFKGEGGCCGGGSDTEKVKKKLDGAVVATKVIHIEGMHCENCKNSVEKQIDAIEGAAAKVHLHKKIAVVELDRPVEDEVLKAAVEKAGFEVKGIEVKEK